MLLTQTIGIIGAKGTNVVDSVTQIIGITIGTKCTNVVDSDHWDHPNTNAAFVGLHAGYEGPRVFFRVVHLNLKQKL